MNPILVFLIIVAAILLWVTCSFLYKPIGMLFGRLFKDAKDAIVEETESKTKNKNEGEN